MKTILTIPILLLLPALSVTAQEWTPVDSRARGMGNAGTAVEDSVSSYSNPAGLAGNADSIQFIEGGFGFVAYGVTDIGLEGDIFGAVDTIADLYNELGGGLGFDQVQMNLNSGTGSNQDLQDAITLVSAICGLADEGLGIAGMAGGGAEIRLGSFGAFYRDFTFAGIDPVVDFSGIIALSSDDLNSFFSQFTAGPLSGAGSALSNRIQNETALNGQDNDTDGALDADELAFAAQVALGDTAISDPTFQDKFLLVVDATVANAGGGAGNTLFSNQSGVEIRGIRIRETGISMGIPLGFMNVGVSLKEVIGETYRDLITLSEIESGENTIEELFDRTDENTKRSNEFSADLGLTITPVPYVRIGIAARNVIGMEFEFAGSSESFKLDPQVKLGVAIEPLGILKFGVDIDITENTFDGLSGFESRLLAGGLELDLSIVRLRAGAYDNLASSESSPVYAAGLGFSLLGLTLDVNAQLSTRKVKIENSSLNTSVDEIPDRFSFSAALGFALDF